MADIFLSYSREDIDRARLLASALEKPGYSVWWDQHLVPGERYSAETEKVLHSADVVLVIWSSASIRSMWVADEATVGRDKCNLVPVCFDNVTPPIGFRQIQTMSLEGWNGAATQEAFRLLAAAIEKRRASAIPAIDAPPSATADQPFATQSSKPDQSKNLRERIAIRPLHAMAALAAIAVLVTAAFVLRNEAASTVQLEMAAPSVASLAVPPFQVNGGNADLQQLSHGMAATLEKQLRAAGIETRGYDFPEDGKLADYIERLGVDYVIRGVVTQIGSELMFNVSLVDVRTKSTVDAIEYLAPDALDIGVVRNVVDAVATKFNMKSTPGGETQQSRDFYIAIGLTSDAAIKSDFERARDLLRKVLKREPANGEAYAHLAYSLASIDRLGDKSEASADEARDAIKKAFQYLGESSEAYFASGLVEYVYRSGTDRLEAARKEFARAIELDPGNVRALKWMTGVLIQLGDYETAIGYADRALAISPDYVDALGNKISALVFLGRRDDVRAELERILKENPHWSFGRRLRASVALMDGDLIRVIKETKLADAIEPIGLNARLESLAYANLQLIDEASASNMRDGEMSKLDPAWTAYKQRIIVGDIEGSLASLQELLSREVRPRLRSDPLVAAGFLNIYLEDFGAATALCGEAVEGIERINAEKFAPVLADACLAIARARSGDTGPAVELIRKYQLFLGEMRGEYRPYWDTSILAALHLAVGDRASALSIVDDLVSNGWRTPGTAICRHCVHLAVDDRRGLFRDLLSDPKFSGLMEEVRADLADQKQRLREQR